MCSYRLHGLWVNCICFIVLQLLIKKKRQADQDWVCHSVFISRCCIHFDEYKRLAFCSHQIWLQTELHPLHLSRRVSGASESVWGSERNVSRLGELKTSHLRRGLGFSTQKSLNHEAFDLFSHIKAYSDRHLKSFNSQKHARNMENTKRKINTSWDLKKVKQNHNTLV